MIDNPYDGCGGNRFRAAVWGRGYLFGLTGPVGVSEQTPACVSAEYRAVFADGARLGRSAATSGLDIFRGAIDTADRGWFPVTAELSVESAGCIDRDAIDVVRVAGSAFAMVLMTFTNVVLANHRVTPAPEVVAGLTRHFCRTVTALGRPACEFYLGGAVDFGDVGGELRLTPLFRSRAEARGAALDFGRPRHFVAGWSCGRPDTLTVLDAHWPSLRHIAC